MGHHRIKNRLQSGINLGRVFEQLVRMAVNGYLLVAGQCVKIEGLRKPGVLIHQLGNQPRPDRHSDRSHHALVFNNGGGDHDRAMAGGPADNETAEHVFAGQQPGKIIAPLQRLGREVACDCVIPAVRQGKPDGRVRAHRFVEDFERGFDGLPAGRTRIRGGRQHLLQSQNSRQMLLDQPLNRPQRNTAVYHHGSLIINMF